MHSRSITFRVSCLTLIDEGPEREGARLSFGVTCSAFAAEAAVAPSRDVDARGVLEPATGPGDGKVPIPVISGFSDGGDSTGAAV